MLKIVKLTGVLTLIGLAIGSVLGLVMGKSALYGAYILMLILAVAMMLISMYYLIGPPKKRFDYFVNRHYKDEKHRDGLFDAIGPVIMAVWFMGLGFFIESLMH